MRALNAALRHGPTVVTGSVLILILVMVIGAPLLTPYGPLEISDRAFQPPSRQHVLGTDEVGRDLFTRILYGGRVSLTVAFLTSMISLLVGVPLGILAGLLRDVREAVIMRIIDALLSFPTLVLALAVVSIFPSNIITIAIALSIPIIPRFARLIRGEVLFVREETFVEAAGALGASDTYIVFRVLLPNVAASTLVGFSLFFSLAILAESQLSFLGFGIQPPFPTWGYMINRGAIFLSLNPWYAMSAGFAIFVTALTLNRFGDAVRDVLDPRAYAKPNRRKGGPSVPQA